MGAEFQTERFEGEDADQVKVIFERLSQDGRFIVSDGKLDFAAIFSKNGELQMVSDGVRVQRKLVENLYVKNLLELKTEGRVFRYSLSEKGREVAEKLKSDERAQLLPLLSGISIPNKPRLVSNEKSYTKPNESPIQSLARKKDKYGKNYISSYMVAAADRLYEDYEIGRIDPQITKKWNEFLDEMKSVPYDVGSGAVTEMEAKARWAGAMRHLGVGLSDISFRVCCTHEGLETAEKMLGWSARSGKIVLRIALIHLAEFYEIPKVR